MPALDFLEIAQANDANGNQDTFELFAHEYLKFIGLTILVGPDRGQDGGRDLLINETRSGILGNADFKWLVSCKHKAHSGQSVLLGDETDIADRVTSFGAQGFIGFYSTVPSSGLNNKLERLKQTGSLLDFNIIYPTTIETMLLSSSKGREIAKRYFPISYREWEQTNREPANLFYQYEPLECKCCGKDLLADRTGIICFLEADNNDDDYNPNTPNKYTAVFWACKGNCDEQLLRKYEKMGHYNIGWEDISDILIPGYFMRWIMGHFNRLRDGDDEYTDEAYSELKSFILRTAQFTLRSQSEADIQRTLTLINLPF